MLHNHTLASAFFLGVVASSAGLASAAQLHVPAGVATLELAVQQAVDGDVILLQPGTYYDLQITISGKSISIVGEGAVPSDTILLGAQPSLGGMPSGSTITVTNAASFKLENVQVVGAKGSTGYPPAQCNGGVGGPGYAALSLGNVVDATLNNVELLGGEGGLGLSNGGHCPAGGKRGDGGPALAIVGGSIASLANSVVEGGDGFALGPAISLNGDSHLNGQRVTLGFASTAWDASAILLLDSSSSVSGVGPSAAPGWECYK